MKHLSISGGIVNTIPKEGDIILNGEELYSLEIMKTIYPLISNSKFEQKVLEVFVKSGDLVEKGQVIMEVEFL